jgi:dynein heavy chain
LLQVEISKTYGMQEWRDDLRKVLKMAGEENKKVTVTAHVVYTASAQ